MPYRKNGTLIRPPRQERNFEDWYGPICAEQPRQACLHCLEYEHCDGCNTPICRYAAVSTDCSLYCRECGITALVNDEDNARDLRYNGP